MNRFQSLQTALIFVLALESAVDGCEMWKDRKQKHLQNKHLLNNSTLSRKPNNVLNVLEGVVPKLVALNYDLLKTKQYSSNDGEEHKMAIDR